MQRRPLFIMSTPYAKTHRKTDITFDVYKENSLKMYTRLFFFSFRLELIPRPRGVSHSDPLPPHVSSPGVIWFQVEKFQVLLNHVHISLLLPSSAAKSPYF